MRIVLRERECVVDSNLREEDLYTVTKGCALRNKAGDEGGRGVRSQFPTEPSWHDEIMSERGIKIS